MEKKLIRRIGDKAIYRVDHNLDGWGIVSLILEGKPPCKVAEQAKRAYLNASSYVQRSVNSYTEDKTVEYRAKGIIKLLQESSHEKQAEILATHNRKLMAIKTHNYMVA